MTTLQSEAQGSGASSVQSLVGQGHRALFTRYPAAQRHEREISGSRRERLQEEEWGTCETNALAQQTIQERYQDAVIRNLLTSSNFHFFFGQRRSPLQDISGAGNHHGNDLIPFKNQTMTK